MKKETFIYVIIAFTLIFMSIGYSALNTNLTISGEAFVEAPKNIRISSVVVKELIDGAYETYSNSFTTSSTNSYVSLPNNTSQVIYEITIYNPTINNYVLKSIEELLFSNDNIDYEIKNIDFTTKLPPGYTTFELVFFHKNETTMDENLNLNLKYNFEIHDYYSDIVLNGADPILQTYLIPVVISPTGLITKADLSSEWYSYGNKQWANAVAIKDSSNRELYSNSISGTVIDDSHIAAYYVWIPRYEYEIWDIPQTSPSWGEDKNEMQEIHINFVNNEEVKKNSTSIGDWFTHPAFSYFDGVTTTELDGFWVNKFELTGVTTDPSSLPLSVPLRNLNLSSYFNTIKNFENLYFNSSEKFDSHLIKNSEWSAIAYLSSSLYGKNSEILPNNYQSQNTGCGANPDNVKGSSTCLNAFGTVETNIYNSSTTGNISGVFDMSGCLWERTMGLQLDSLGQINFASSGFTELNSKYYDVYKHSTSGNQYVNSGYGQAISETAGWYNDYSTIPNGATNHWTLRSGDQNGGTSSGIFSFMTSSGTSYWTHGTRGSLWVYE